MWFVDQWPRIRGGGILQMGDHLHQLQRARCPQFFLREGPLVPQWLVGHRVPFGLGVRHLNNLQGALAHGAQVN